MVRRSRRYLCRGGGTGEAISGQRPRQSADGDQQSRGDHARHSNGAVITIQKIVARVDARRDPASVERPDEEAGVCHALARHSWLLR